MLPDDTIMLVMHFLHTQLCRFNSFQGTACISSDVKAVRTPDWHDSGPLYSTVVLTA